MGTIIHILSSKVRRERKQRENNKYNQQTRAEIWNYPFSFEIFWRRQSSTIRYH